MVTTAHHRDKPAILTSRGNFDPCPAMDAHDADVIVGCTDGFKNGHVEGWAWRPQCPHDAVIVEMLIDGHLAGEATACVPRPDLQTAGIGNGNYAFAIPLEIAPDAPSCLHITIRAKNGPVLPGGEFDLMTLPEERAELARRQSTAHLEQIFGAFTAATPPPPRGAETRPVPKLHFILYSAISGSALANTLGMPEYSYYFVMHGFRQVLRKLGIVHVVRDPAHEVNEIYDRSTARGEGCIFLSFAPPQSTILGLRCPTIPVIAWEFGTIPTGGWGSDAREDWRLVLRQTGRAITISDFAARAVRAAMGADFPVAFIPTPVWDRQSTLRARLADMRAGRPDGPVLVKLGGLIWDSRDATLSLDMRPPGLPRMMSPAPVATLPMRGAQLTLARARAALLAQAAADAIEADRRAADARAEAMRLQEVRLAEAARAAEEMLLAADMLAAEQTIAAPPSPPATARQRLRITAFLARQWYRDVLRDLLPRPLTKAASHAGRVVVGLRRPGQMMALPASPNAALDATPDVALVIAEPTPEMALVSAPAPETDPDLPPTSRYLPVGDPLQPEPEAAPARHLPAVTADPLPEPALAVFYPDPYPRASARPPSLVQASLDGIVFTAVLSPKDGRKNWQDILTAFATAFRDTPQATLVLKMIGTDPTFWWWEFHGIVKLLPPFACRVLVLCGFLDDNNYHTLIGATHFVVNASLAEGQCLPLVEFMSASRPAIAPAHSAMLDYITPDNALIVASAAEFCSWPHDPRNHLITSRHRIEWTSLRDAFAAALRIAEDEPGHYAAMGAAAAASVAAYCADEVVAPRLAAFLGLGDEVVLRAGWQPLPRPAAEALLETWDDTAVEYRA